MKRVLSIIVMLTVLMVNVATAKSIVKETERFTISANEETSWTIEYNAPEKGVEVIKLNTKKGEEYIVRNKFFEVRYVNTEKGFGARSIKASQSTIDPIFTDNVINANELSKQASLSAVKLDEEKALSYIAGFVPFLLNENYKHLLN
ncbi:MAG: hypothetical protein JXR22_01770 [Prolixibacteraceae bacterium]|nr:hypothetical protein [Prolixibacteraceae bacterium]